MEQRDPKSLVYITEYDEVKNNSNGNYLKGSSNRISETISAY